MKKIKLTRGKYALVDDEDFERLNQYNWHASFSGTDKWYARRDYGNGHFCYMHWEVLGCGKGVDHIDSNGLNNRRKNLRKADQSVNNQNRKKKAGTSSRYIGVSWDKRDKKWLAQVKYHRKAYRLGLFKSEIEAAHTYDAAVRKLYEGYVKTNFSSKGGNQ